MNEVVIYNRVFFNWRPYLVTQSGILLAQGSRDEVNQGGNEWSLVLIRHSFRAPIRKRLLEMASFFWWPKA